MSSRLRARTLALVFALLAAAMVTAPVSAAPPPIDPMSAAEKTVWVDVATGNITRVEAGTRNEAGDLLDGDAAAAQPTASISHRNFCEKSYVCYFSGKVPWADQGFWGSPGVVRGNWPERSGGRTAGYGARFCWAEAGKKKCQSFGLDTTFWFNGHRTGLEVQLY